MSSSRVQVLTLAELGFTVLFAVIIISLPLTEQSAQLREERDKYKSDRDNLAAELANERQKNASLAAAVANAPGKLSNIPPRCDAEPLERAIIVGPDQFDISGMVVNSQTINRRHAADIAWADSHKCHHRVAVNWIDNLSASDFASAIQRLERNFYVMRLGGVGTLGSVGAR